MHVLAGKYRRRLLQASASESVRPTARRVREALFEFLSFRVEGARFLDLCAGSGAVGIEALSRGAGHATFVDRSPKMCGFIEANLKGCGVTEDSAEIWMSDAGHFLRRMTRARQRSWDVAFFDPPYASSYAQVLEAFAAGALLKPKGGVLVVEHSAENILPDQLPPLKRWRIIRQGESCLSFYEQKN